MARTDYTSIGIERTHFSHLQSAKKDLERKAGRSFRWGDFLMMLIAFRDLQEQAVQPGEPLRYAEMGQDSENPLTGDEPEAAGMETFTGIPLTLSDEDREYIVEAVVEKLAARIEEMLGRLRR